MKGIELLPFLTEKQKELLNCIQQSLTLCAAGDFQNANLFAVHFTMQFHAVADGRTVLVLHRTKN